MKEIKIIFVTEPVRKKNYCEIALTLGFVMYLKCKKNLRRLTKVNKFILGYGEVIERKKRK